MNTPIITCPVCNTRYEENYSECPNCSFKTIHHQAYMDDYSKEPKKIFNDTYGLFTFKSFIAFVIFGIALARLIMFYYGISLASLFN